jgi:hypothetical protein
VAKESYTNYPSGTKESGTPQFRRGKAGLCYSVAFPLVLWPNFSVCRLAWLDVPQISRKRSYFEAILFENLASCSTRIPASTAAAQLTRTNMAWLNGKSAHS